MYLLLYGYPVPATLPAFLDYAEERIQGPEVPDVVYHWTHSLSVHELDAVWQFTGNSRRMTVVLRNV